MLKVRQRLVVYLNHHNNTIFFFVGELTNELDEGDYITEFVSGGPKNYAYSTWKGKQTCKIRGFSLNYANAQLLNFDTMTELVSSIRPNRPSTYKNSKRKREVEDDDAPPVKVIVTTNPTKICRDKAENVLYNREEKKVYKSVYDKRVILQSMDTIPYRY